MATTTAWQGPERRQQLRLRRLIDALWAGQRGNQEALEYLREPVGALAVDLEETKRLEVQTVTRGPA
jgi:hypothetical protein